VAPHLWDRFYVARDAMLRLGARLWEQRQRTFPAVQLRPPFLDATSALEGSKSLVGAANEVYLLHGTRPETVHAICSHGMNERYSGGLFGCGTYFAEVADKTNQYVVADRGVEATPGIEALREKMANGSAQPSAAQQPPSTQTPPQQQQQPPPPPIFYAFVCRVCLGHAVRTYDGQRNDDDLRQPVFANASKRELSTIPGADPPGTPYHSILVEKGGRVKRHREFVCMHSDQTYPEYLIAFTREWVDPP